ncbi:MAG: hypothetical protein ACI90V_006398, partial [Bacillariaceae sp.]
PGRKIGTAAKPQQTARVHIARPLLLIKKSSSPDYVLATI